MGVRALISNIALPRGAHLEIAQCSPNTGLIDIIGGISTTHLSNLPSPTSIDYGTHPRHIELSGPNGSLSFYSLNAATSEFFIEFPVLPLTSVREFRLTHANPLNLPYPIPLAHHLSFFPSLETLAIGCRSGIPYLSTLLQNPSFPPSLTNLAFLNCDLSEQFMEELAQFASDRKNTTSARLHRVVIVDLDGKFPSSALINALERHIPVVDLRRGRDLPTDLT